MRLGACFVNHFPIHPPNIHLPIEPSFQPRHNHPSCRIQGRFRHLLGLCDAGEFLPGCAYRRGVAGEVGRRADQRTAYGIYRRRIRRGVDGEPQALRGALAHPERSGGSRGSGSHISYCGTPCGCGKNPHAANHIKRTPALSMSISFDPFNPRTHCQAQAA